MKMADEREEKMQMVEEGRKRKYEITYPNESVTF
jgi:hypothetical protein